jgi:hypothetical protein
VGLGGDAPGDGEERQRPPPTGCDGARGGDGADERQERQVGRPRFDEELATEGSEQDEQPDGGEQDAPATADRPGAGEHDHDGSDVAQRHGREHAVGQRSRQEAVQGDDLERRGSRVVRLLPGRRAERGRHADEGVVPGQDVVGAKGHGCAVAQGLPVTDELERRDDHRHHGAQQQHEVPGLPRADAGPVHPAGGFGCFTGERLQSARVNAGEAQYGRACRGRDLLVKI